jgi:hypothetical protein
MSRNKYELTYLDGRHETVDADDHRINTRMKVSPDGDRAIPGRHHVFYKLKRDDSGRLPEPYVVDYALLVDVRPVFPLPTP